MFGSALEEDGDGLDKYFWSDNEVLVSEEEVFDKEKVVSGAEQEGRVVVERRF